MIKVNNRHSDHKQRRSYEKQSGCVRTLMTNLLDDIKQKQFVSALVLYVERIIWHLF